MIFFKFILWFILAEAIVIAVHFLIRKHEFKLWEKIVIIVSEFVFSILMAFMPMGGPMALRPLHPFMMALYVATMMDSIACAIILTVNHFSTKKQGFISLTAISCVLGVLFLTFGIVNMQIVTPKYYSYTSSKLQNEYKIAFVSDMHIGGAQTIETSIKAVNKIKDENPDFTFLGGDIVDEYTEKEDMQAVLAAFKDFSTPVYFIYGNHDPYGKFTVEEFEAALIENNIIIVQDEFISLGSDLTFLGREDASSDNRKDVSELANPYPDTYLLVIDHQPMPFEDNCALGVDLQISGHTHAGQLFPLRQMYVVIGNCYGEYHNGDSTLIISSGESGWRCPLRTSYGCHYEIVTISPNA